MITKIILLCLSAGWLLLVANPLYAAGIAVVSHANITPYKLAIDGFRSQVDLPLHEYHLNRDNEHQDEIEHAISQQHPELIFALGKSALSVAREINSSAPIIFAFVLHPEHVSRPGNRIRHRESGIAMTIDAEQQFKMLLRIVPSAHRIGVIYDPNKSAALIRQAKHAASRLGIHLVAVAATNQKAAARAIADIITGVDAMWMVPDNTVLTSTTFRQMVRLSLKDAVVLIGLAPKYVRAGSLFSLSFDSRSVGKQAGKMARGMLNGRKFTALLAPDTVNLLVNRQTAKRLGLKLPEGLLQQTIHSYPEHNGGGGQ